MAKNHYTEKWQVITHKTSNVYPSIMHKKKRILTVHCEIQLIRKIILFFTFTSDTVLFHSGMFSGFKIISWKKKCHEHKAQAFFIVLASLHQTSNIPLQAKKIHKQEAGRGGAAQLVERRLVIERLLVQCSNRCKDTLRQFPIRAEQSTRRGGPVRLKTCKQNR